MLYQQPSPAYLHVQKAEDRTAEIIKESKVRDKIQALTRLPDGQADISGAKAGEVNMGSLRETLRNELVPLSEAVINKVLWEYEQLTNFYSRGEAGVTYGKHRTPAEKKALSEHLPRMKKIKEAQRRATAIAAGEKEALLPPLEVAAGIQAGPLKNRQAIAIPNPEIASKIALTRPTLQQELAQQMAYKDINIDIFFEPGINEVSF